jgi:hypothetical protein
MLCLSACTSGCSYKSVVAVVTVAIDLVTYQLLLATTMNGGDSEPILALL